MNSRQLDERTPWQRTWPWCMGFFTLLVQALSFTDFQGRLTIWHVPYSTPLMALPLLGPLLVLACPATWIGPRLRWLRALVLASVAVWFVLTGGGVVLALFRDGMKLGVAMKTADLRDRREPAPSRPSRLYATLDTPRVAQGWVFVFWGGLTGIGTLALKRLQDAKEEAAR